MSDDTQLYCIFQTLPSMAKISSIISDLRCWMAQNFLKLNDSKTEVIFVGTKQECKKVVLPNLTIDDVEIKVCSEHAIRYIGVMFDSQM